MAPPAVVAEVGLGAAEPCQRSAVLVSKGRSSVRSSWSRGRSRGLVGRAGAAAALAVRWGPAVPAGRLLALLPQRVGGAVAAGLFAGGSAYLWAASFGPGRGEGADAARQGGRRASFVWVAALSFGVVFL